MTLEQKYIDGRAYISAFRSNLTEDKNNRRTLILFDMLITAGFDVGGPVEAMCDGHIELTFVPKRVAPRDIPLLLKIARRFQQDSIIVDGLLIECATNRVLTVFTKATLFNHPPDSPYWTRFGNNEYVVLS